MKNDSDKKIQVHNFWNDASCGEALYLPTNDLEGFKTQSESRYALEPYILDFAKFTESANLKVLEIGVGLGADHQKFAEAGAILYGIDLTQRAVDYTRQRMFIQSLSSELLIGDAEYLNFTDNYFDIIYSWGLLHHSADTPKAVAECLRVLKPNGVAKVMIYHKWSMVGIMLWLRYGLLGFKPWLSLKKIYDQYLESTGTKAYSIRECKSLFNGFSNVQIRTVLTHADLLDSQAGQRYQGTMLKMSRKNWPRWFIRRWLPGLGLFMLIEARK